MMVRKMKMITQTTITCTNDDIIFRCEGLDCTEEGNIDDNDNKLVMDTAEIILV